MLGNDAMEFLKTLHHLDEIWKHHDDAEYNDRQLTQFAERYHEHKLKLLGITDVVGQSEQLSCKCGLPKRKEGIGFSCMRTDCDANIAN